LTIRATFTQVFGSTRIQVIGCFLDALLAVKIAIYSINIVWW